MVVTFQSAFRSATAIKPRMSAMGLTIFASILLHALLGWYVVSQLISGMPIVDEQPIAIEITRVEPAPPPPPVVKPDEPIIRDLPPPPVHRPPFVPDAAVVEPTPLQPAPEAPITRPAPTLDPAPPAPLSAPAPTYRAPVSYPARAEAREIEGRATVQITVGAGGRVESVQVVDETPQGYRFGEAAADSVWKWEFADAQPGTYRVTVRFKLD
jgi:protein TonB